MLPGLSKYRKKGKIPPLESCKDPPSNVSASSNAETKLQYSVLNRLWIPLNSSVSTRNSNLTLELISHRCTTQVKLSLVSFQLQVHKYKPVCYRRGWWTTSAGGFVFFFQCNSLEDDLSFTESLVFWKTGSVIDLSQNCGAANWLGYHRVAGQKRTHARRWQLCAPERSLSVRFTQHLTVAAGKRVNTCKYRGILLRMNSRSRYLQPSCRLNRRRGCEISSVACFITRVKLRTWLCPCPLACVIGVPCVCHISACFSGCGCVPLHLSQDQYCCHSCRPASSSFLTHSPHSLYRVTFIN